MIKNRIARILKKRWIPIGAIVLVGLLVFLATKPKVVEVDVGNVTRGGMEVTVEEDGFARVCDVFTISSPVTGSLDRIKLETGDPVEKGQVVAAIHPLIPELLDIRSREEAEARVKAAEAAVHRANSARESAESEVTKLERYLKRDQERLREGNISEPTLEDTRHALLVAQRDRDAATASHEMARFEQDAAVAILEAKPGDAETCFELQSPITGVVLGVPKESERTVNRGEALLDLGDPNQIEIRCDILSPDAVKVQKGQRVVIDHWGGEVAMKGVVRRVEPTAFTKVSALGVDEQRVWVTIDPLEPVASGVESGNRLGHDYRVEVRIVIWENRDALIAPAGALFRSAEGWAAYRVGGGNRAESVALEIGRRNATEVEILSGISEGERLILHPGDRVDEGTKLRIR